MKAFRSLLFWTHLTAGVVGGVVILIMSFTGVVLALRPQIQNWVDREVRYVTPGNERMPASALLAAVKAADPEANPQQVSLVREPNVAALVSLGREGNIYVNPYTGAILGRQSQDSQAFFQSMTAWHRTVNATGEWRGTGRAWTGASNLAFLFLGLSGLYIWWPKQMTMRHFRPILWFRSTNTGKARDFNWHNVIGFWCAIPIVIMTASGAVISYQWASNLVYTLTGTPIPQRGPGGGEGGPGRGRGGEQVARAEGQAPREGQGERQNGGRRDEARGAANEQPAEGAPARREGQGGREGQAAREGAAARQDGAREGAESTPRAEGAARADASPRAEAAPGREGGRGGRPEGGPGGPGGPGGNGPTVIPTAIDQLVARAEQQMPTWSQLSYRLPSRDGAPVQFTLTDGEHWNPMGRSQLTLNGATAEVVQWQPYVEQNLGQRARGWMRFAHTGELGGLTGQIIAGIGCLGGVFLVYTGFALAFRRLLNWSLWRRFSGARTVKAQTATAAASVRQPLMDEQ